MPMRHKVLIVDDEDIVTMTILRTLYQDNHLYDVLLARTGEIAQNIMEENEIDVLVTDVRLPGMSGLDLLCWASTESPKTRAIVITAYDVDRLSHRAGQFGCLQVVQKPLDLKEMRDRILNLLDADDAMTGSLATFSPADVVQMLCIGNKTAGLRVIAGSDHAVINIVKGQVVHAVWNEKEGEEAFYEVLRMSSGMFNTVPLPIEGPRTITRSWQHLLMEGMRIEDENNRDESIEATEAKEPKKGGLVEKAQQAMTVEEPRGPEDENQVAQLIDDGFEKIRTGDLDKAQDCWEKAQELDPENRMIQLNLAKLKKLSATE